MASHISDSNAGPILITLLSSIGSRLENKEQQVRKIVEEVEQVKRASTQIETAFLVQQALFNVRMLYGDVFGYTLDKVDEMVKKHIQQACLFADQLEFTYRNFQNKGGKEEEKSSKILREKMAAGKEECANLRTEVSQFLQAPVLEGEIPKLGLIHVSKKEEQGEFFDIQVQGYFPPSAHVSITIGSQILPLPKIEKTSCSFSNAIKISFPKESTWTVGKVKIVYKTSRFFVFSVPHEVTIPFYVPNG